MNFLADSHNIFNTNVKIQNRNHLEHNFRKGEKCNFEDISGALTLYNLYRKEELDWNVQCTLDLVTDLAYKETVTKSHNVNDFVYIVVF